MISAATIGMTSSSLATAAHRVLVESPRGRTDRRSSRRPLRVHGVHVRLDAVGESREMARAERRDRRGTSCTLGRKQVPALADIDADGAPQLIFNTTTHLGYASGPDALTALWPFVPVPPGGEWSHYAHGFGHGDVNGGNSHRSDPARRLVGAAGYARTANRNSAFTASASGPAARYWSTMSSGVAASTEP